MKINSYKVTTVSLPEGETILTSDLRKVAIKVSSNYVNTQDMIYCQISIGDDFKNNQEFKNVLIQETFKCKPSEFKTVVAQRTSFLIKVLTGSIDEDVKNDTITYYINRTVSDELFKSMNVGEAEDRESIINKTITDLITDFKYAKEEIEKLKEGHKTAVSELDKVKELLQSNKDKTAKEILALLAE